MDQSIPPFGDGENVTLMSTEVPHASMLQTSVHGCDAPVADVTRVLRTCAPLHPALARLARFLRCPGSVRAARGCLSASRPPCFWCPGCLPFLRPEVAENAHRQSL